jgi:AcrR family transcriptional regulator
LARRRRELLPDEPGREVILQVATRLFGEKGYHATSVRDISAEMGLLAGSLYSHIGGKRELLAEIFRRRLERMTGELREIAQAEAPARQKLRLAFALYLRLIAEDIPLHRVLIHEFRSLEADELARVHERRDVLVDLVTQIVEQGVEAGEFRAVPTRLTSLVMISITQWAAEWFDPNGTLSVEEMADFLAELVVEGLAPRCDPPGGQNLAGKGRWSMEARPGT